MKSKKPRADIVLSAEDRAPVLRDIEDEPLTPEERLWVREYVTKGTSVFRRMKWDSARCERFLARPNVKADVQNWTDLFQHGDAILAKQLGGMLDEALLIIRRALRGMTPDANGKTPDAKNLPDPSQVDLAWKILASCGVDRSLFKTANSTGVLADEAPGVGGPDAERKYDIDKTLTKEKARAALSFISTLIAAASNDKKDAESALDETKQRQRTVEEQRRRAGLE